MKAFGAGSHLLSSRQLGRQGLLRLIKLAEILQPISRGEKITDVLRGAVLANLFFEPSTRSRISFGAAFARLGGSVLDTTGTVVTSLSKGESIEDTARVVSGYADAIVVRHSEIGAPSMFAKASLIPVINAGDGAGEHPTQALTDLFTMFSELGARGKRLDGSRIALVGDLRYGRTTHSLMITLAQFEAIQFVLLYPAGLEMPEADIQYAVSRGHKVEVAKDLPTALSGADIVYMTRYQTERFAQSDSIPIGWKDLRLDAKTVAACAPADLVIMHPLPRSTDFGELSTDLDGSTELAIFRQTDNGVPIRMAVFCTILDVDEKMLSRSICEPAWNIRKRKNNVPT